MKEQKLLIEEMHGKRGNLLKITLNSEKNLNALSFKMIQELRRELSRASIDPQIVCIVITGAGEKAFCAGGDIKGCYQKIAENRFDEADDFFREEYTMNYELGVFEKPLICLVDGLALGGGVGVMQGCKYRVIEANTKFGMPETQIGLFPDAGANFFLRSIPRNTRLFLALTASVIGAGDIFRLGLADFTVPLEEFSALTQSLLTLDWSDSIEENHRIVSDYLKSRSTPSILPEPELPDIQESIDKVFASGNLEEICRDLMQIPENLGLVKRAKQNLEYASPLSLALTFRAFDQPEKMPLKEALNLEYRLAIRCARFGDFKEGVRALLIDRDRNPGWLYRNLSEISEEILDRFFLENTSILS